MAKSDEPVRQVVHFEGRVQGVGFRYTARHLASDFHVTGFVENLPDGRVRLVAEGTAAELERFVQAIRTRMDHYIRSVQVSVEAANGQFKDFGVRR